MTKTQKIEDKFLNLFEDNLRSELAGHATLKTYQSGSTIMEVGMSITHMPLVLTGSVKVMMEDKEGDELLLYYLEWGDTCAVTLNCWTGRATSKVKAVAEQETELLMIPVTMMDLWMAKYRSWRSFVLESYNQRLNEMLEAMDTLAFMSMEDRLKRYLMDKYYVRKTYTVDITHKEIADDLHSSRVVISRLMKSLEKGGFLEQGRNKVILNEKMVGSAFQN